MPQPRAESILHSDVINLFEEHALRGPKARCVSLGNRKISYGDLKNELANHISAQLKERDLGPGSLVAVYLERSPELVAAILGIPKAGAGYLPIDPMVPEKRLAYVLADSGVTTVITQPGLRQHLGDRPSLLISELGPQDGGTVADAPAHEWHGDELAYVIYTSGSTGRPKGVEILHRSLALCVESIRRELGVTPSDTLLGVTSQSFDVSVMEIFLTLTSGAHLVLFPQASLMQGDLLRAALEENEVTLLFGTPSLWRLLVETGWRGNAKLRGVIGGELLESELANTLVRKTGALWNDYETDERPQLRPRRSG